MQVFFLLFFKLTFDFDTCTKTASLSIGLFWNKISTCITFSASRGKDKSLKDLENDLVALESRIKNLDADVTPNYTDDNIHGDTPTPTRQLSIVSQSHEGVSESCGTLLKKLDVVQIGFVQIQRQNKQMVRLVWKYRLYHLLSHVQNVWGNYNVSYDVWEILDIIIIYIDVRKTLDVCKILLQIFYELSVSLFNLILLATI